MHRSFSSLEAKAVIVALFLAAPFGRSTSGSPFLNLGFDDGDTNKVVFGDVGYAWGKTEDFLPEWHLVSGTTTIQLIGIGNVLGALGDAMLFNGEGRFLLGLLPNSDGSSNLSIPYSLSQTGDVPQDAKAIHFLTYGPNFPPFAHWSLTLEGMDIPLIYLRRPSAIEANDVYGDVSAFAGQTVNLTLTTIPTDRAFDYALDSISFSSTIPEPSPFLLTLLGSSLLIWWLRQRNPMRNRNIRRMANQGTAPNAGIALSFQSKHPSPGVGEFDR